MSFRGSKRSKSLPMNGEQMATEMAARLNACEICSRLHPKSYCQGLINRVKSTRLNACEICSRLHPKSYCQGLINRVKMVKKMVAIPVSTPSWQTTTTRQPG